MNFIKIATAQAIGRYKEVGVRKVLGSQPKHLFWQFRAETAVIVSLSMLAAVILSYLSLPYLNHLLDTSLPFNIFEDTYFILFLPVLLMVVVVLSGTYPGLILAGFKPIQAFQGKLTQKNAGSISLRKGLVVVQFAISQLLIISTLVIANQMRYSGMADMGFQKDGIVMLSLPDNESSKIKGLRSKFSQLAAVEYLTFCNDAPTSESSPSTTIRLDSRTEDELFLSV